MLEAHAQVVIVDPVGVWYGLRVRRRPRARGSRLRTLGLICGRVALAVGPHMGLGCQ